jgi:hypothetical protein
VSLTKAGSTLRGLDKQRREPLHPTKQGDVINLNTTLGEELLEIAIRQTEPEVPAHRQHDHLRREPEPHERRKLLDWRCGPTATLHHHTLTHRRAIRQRNRAELHTYRFKRKPPTPLIILDDRQRAAPFESPARVT